MAFRVPTAECTLRGPQGDRKGTKKVPGAWEKLAWLCREHVISSAGEEELLSGCEHLPSVQGLGQSP